MTNMAQPRCKLLVLYVLGALCCMQFFHRILLGGGSNNKGLEYLEALVSNHNNLNNQFSIFKDKDANGPKIFSTMGNAMEDANNNAHERIQKEFTELLLFDRKYCNGTLLDTKRVSGASPLLIFEPPSDAKPRSLQVKGKGLVEVYSIADEQINNGREYRGVIMEMDGCFTPPRTQNMGRREFRLHAATNTSIVLTAKRQITLSSSKGDTGLQQIFSTAPNLTLPHTRIVFSASSSHYFGYQVYANAYAFLQSQQINASWMRLLTARQPDDLSERVPTFTAPKCVQSDSYNPINKPDVLNKWFHSLDAPHPQDVIAVIDPDNWLLKDISPWTQRVQEKHAVGMQAYYYTMEDHCRELWHTFCLKNCDKRLDLVGVPYLIQASDLQQVAPVWKDYTLRIKDKLDRNETFQKQWEWLGIDWSAEMFGFNFACAHLGIRVKAANNLQVRDVETSTDVARWSVRPMIHMGRAWFPKPKENETASANNHSSLPWRHEDDGGMPEFGHQVWCKCNDTAGEIIPWPLPETDDLDFVSRHTLEILHHSREYFGPVPMNKTFRRPDNYYWAAP